MKIRKPFFLIIIAAILGMVIACVEPAISASSEDSSTTDDEDTYYAVSFQANGGSPSPQNQTIIKNGKVTQPTAMTKIGYGFDGWYKEAAFINFWNFTNNIVTGNITLYAKWNPTLPPAIVQGTTLAEKLKWLNENAASNGTYILEVNSDEYLNPHTLSYSGKSNITIQLTGIESVKNIEIYTSGSLFTIGNNVTLILNENIVLKGKTNNTAPLVMVNGGNLILNDGSKITGNSTSTYGGGVRVSSGTFNMIGGIISGNTSSNGGGVYLGGGTFNMIGGTINGNTSSNGGGVYLGSGTFTMTGGEISGNTASSYGGGVYISAVSKSEFRKTGGIITGYLSDTVNGNVVKNYSSVQNNRGHAVYAAHDDNRFIKYKEFTAEQQNNLTYIRNEPEPIKSSGDWNSPIPDAPSAPVVTVSSYSLTVQWTAVECALSYEVWMGTTNNSASAAKRADVFGTNTTLTGLANGTTYYIWLKAKNDTGTSGFSPAASGTPSAFAVIPQTPSAPVITLGDKRITVSWTAVEGALSYEVWLGTTVNPTTAVKHGDDVSNLFLVINGLTNHTTYYVWIKAKNEVGISGFSPTASGTPSAFAVIPQTPSAPVITLGDKRITVSWTAVEGALAYEVWLGTSNNSAYANKHDANIDDSLFVTIDSLNNGTTYYVWIKAKNDIGTSGFSPSAIGMPMGNAVTPTLTASNGQLTASWSSIAGANQYEVFCGTGINPPQTALQTVNATTAAITGLANGTTYNVWIRGKNITGTGVISSPSSAKPIGSMGAVTAALGDGQLSLSWSTVDGADQYEVYYSTSSSIPANSAQTVTATTATIAELTNGTTYNVWVKPKNANGTGGTSAAASGRPLGTPVVSTVNAGFEQISVSWTAVTGADEYEVYYGSETANTLYTTVKNGTTATIYGLVNGTTYYVLVKGRNTTGAGNASTVVSAKPIGGMGAVSLVSGNGQLTASWSTVAGADQYEVYHSTTTTIPASPAQTVMATTATISELTNGTTYYVWVKPKNSGGVGAISTIVNGVPMAVPDNLTVSAANQQITVSWTAVMGASSYEVYYSTTTTIPTSAAFTVTETNRTFTSLTNGTTYYFWVKAVNANGTSAASPRASAKPIGNMGAVTLVSGNGQLTASWSIVAGADQYEVYHNTTATIPTSPAQTVTATTATITGLTNGTTYYVWVKGKNTNGTGNASTAVSAKPLGTPSAPTVNAGIEQISVSWIAIAGADQYEVYYGIGTANTLFTTVTGTTATITGLVNNTTYTVRLRAKNSTGASDYGPTAIATPTKAGLYKGIIIDNNNRIGNQNLTDSLTYISTNAADGDNYLIVLGADESVSPKTLSYSGKTVGITLSGYGGERTVTLASNGSLFSIGNSVTLTLDEDISLVGMNTNNRTLVSVGLGTFTMNGGTISGNTASSYGGGVYVIGGTFTMNGGTISGNTASGGGVCVDSNGTFTMTGGAISENTASGNGGGGVYVGSNGTFTMTDGTISGNTASDSSGGGVYVSGGNFTMHGGTISGNATSGNRAGGGVYVMNSSSSGGDIVSGTFTMHGGTISGNTADLRGGGVYLTGRSRFEKTGGIITGYLSDTVNGNVAKNRNGVIENNGHAVYAGGSAGFTNIRRKETTAGANVNLYYDNTANPPTFSGVWD